jgi:alpha-glucoside transport system permease protein
MDNIAGKRSALVWVVHLSALMLVILWTLPTAGLLISSFRNADQIATSGWWNALIPSERNFIVRAGDASAQREEGGRYVITGSVFEDGGGVVNAFGTTSVKPEAYAPGEIAVLNNGRTLTVAADGAYQFASPTPFEGRSPRIFVTAVTPPDFTTDNYDRVLNAEGLGRAFLNTMTVAIPSTIIPILIAAFAAYALAWMEFPGRALLIAAIVGLFVVPLQLALIPLLQLHNQLGIGKEYLGIWLAHAGFGLPDHLDHVRHLHHVEQRRDPRHDVLAAGGGRSHDSIVRAGERHDQRRQRFGERVFIGRGVGEDHLGHAVELGRGLGNRLGA